MHALPYSNETSLEALKQDAFDHEARNPQLAAEIYKMIAMRCEQAQQKQTYLSLAQHFCQEAIRLQRRNLLQS